MGERGSRSWHRGRQVSSPMDPPVPGSCLSHFPIWCCISGDFTPEIIGHFLCLSREASVLVEAISVLPVHKLKYLEKPFHLFNAKLLVFQSLFQHMLILNQSFCKSWLKGIWHCCFSYVVACFYRNILSQFYKWFLDSCCKRNVNPIFGLQSFV